jgi:hypothetical protein
MQQNCIFSRVTWSNLHQVYKISFWKQDKTVTFFFFITNMSLQEFLFHSLPIWHACNGQSRWSMARKLGLQDWNFDSWLIRQKITEL